jgi:serine protease AprX
MVNKRVLVNFFNEAARDKVREKVQQRSETDSFIIGEIDENDIPNLQQQQGLIVEALDDNIRVVETPGRTNELSSSGFLISARITEPITESIDQTKPNFYIIKFKGPLLDGWRRQIDNLGVRLIESIPYYNFTANLTPEQVSSIKSLPYVDNVHLYDEADTGVTTFTSTLQPTRRGDETKMLTYDAVLHRKEDLQNVINWLKSHNVNIVASSGKIIRFDLSENSNVLQEMRRLPDIAQIQEFVPSEFHNDISRIILGIENNVNSEPSAGSTNTINISQTGEDQIIAIADSGIYDSHPDFKGRIIGITSWGRRDRNDHSDPIGHGTHVAGSILGDGSASGGKIRGTAPQAKMFFQSLVDDKGQLALPLNLADLFDEAYQAKARISSNSYGAPTGSVYYITSLQIDDYVANHRDMLIVRSAGNDGTAANPRNSKKGYVDWLSIGSPATCKNGLTVGATRSSRTDGPSKDSVWGTWTDRLGRPRFPDEPIAKDKVCGNPECMAAFSSRGPSDDHRIKPDVVAPGTDILSTRSSLAPENRFWGLYPGNENYAYMGGTSMATPLVAGCAALVREYYTKNQNHNPSAALLKATLINGTKWLLGQDSTADHNKLPNYHQGFGLVHMPQTIPNKSNPNLKLEFVDSWNDEARQFSSVGQIFTFQLSKIGNTYLRVCLAYTDPPGRGLQNDLNLFLEHKESGQIWYGNQDVPFSWKIPDPDNNVEVIRLETSTPGTYNIHIQAKNLLSLQQDFALVVTGEGISSLVQI